MLVEHRYAGVDIDSKQGFVNPTNVSDQYIAEAVDAGALIPLAKLFAHDGRPIPHRPDDLTKAKNKQKQSRLCSLPQELINMIKKYIDPASDSYESDHGQYGFPSLSLALTCRYFFESERRTLTLMYRDDMAPFHEHRFVFVDAETTGVPPYCNDIYDGFDNFMNEWGLGEWEAFIHDFKTLPEWRDEVHEQFIRMSADEVEMPAENLMTSHHKQLMRTSPPDASLFVRLFGRPFQFETVNQTELVLRNHTTREAVLGRDLRLSNQMASELRVRMAKTDDDTEFSMQRLFDKLRPDKMYWSLGEAIAVMTLFVPAYKNRWAGHRFDIVPLRNANLWRWTNVRQEVVDQLAMFQMTDWAPEDFNFHETSAKDAWAEAVNGAPQVTS